MPMATIDKTIHGLVGNLVITKNGNVRTKPVYTKKSKRSPKQVKNRKSFSYCAEFYQKMKKDLVTPIWTKMKDETRNAYNLFMSANIKAFYGEDGKCDPMKLKLSLGVLNLPFRFKWEKFDKENSDLIISWENASEESEPRLADKFSYVLSDGVDFSKPIYSNFHRNDRGGVVNLSGQDFSPSFVYIYFTAYDNSEFSDSTVMEIPKSL